MKDKGACDEAASEVGAMWIKVNSACVDGQDENKQQQRCYSFTCVNSNTQTNQA